MEKARLTQEAADALNKLQEEGFKPEVIVARHANVEWLWESGHLNELNLDQICRAVYVGVEVIEGDQVITVTPELLKEIQDYFLERQNDDREWMVGWRRGYKDALALLGIKA